MNGSSVKPGVATAGCRAFLVGVTTACAATGTREFGQTATPMAPSPEGGKWYRTAGELVADLAASRADRLGKQGVAVARLSPLLPDLVEATRNNLRLLGPATCATERLSCNGTFQRMGNCHDPTVLFLLRQRSRPPPSQARCPARAQLKRDLRLLGT